MDNELRAAIALLRSDLVWSDDFESIREPLADLLEALRRVPTKQFDDYLVELISALEGRNVPPARDPMELWVAASSKQLTVDDTVADYELAKRLKKFLGL